MIPPERKSVLAPAEDPEIISLATTFVLRLETQHLNELIAKAEQPNRCGCQLNIDGLVNEAWRENHRLDPCGKQDEEELMVRYANRTAELEIKHWEDKKKKRKPKKRDDNYWENQDE